VTMMRLWRSGEGVVMAGVKWVDGFASPRRQTAGNRSRMRLLVVRRANAR
jgi:hypothetical protein